MQTLFLFCFFVVGTEFLYRLLYMLALAYLRSWTISMHETDIRSCLPAWSLRPHPTERLPSFQTYCFAYFEIEVCYVIQNPELVCSISGTEFREF